MGRPKIKIIDDSQPTEEIKTPQIDEVKKSTDAKAMADKKKGVTDSLVESLKAELGIVDETPQPKADRPSDEKKEETPKKVKKTTQKAGKVKYRSKKYLEVTLNLDKAQKYSLNEALDLVQKTSYTKFEGSVEAHINTNVKNVRGLVSLPFASGKKLTILAFGKNAEDSGADLIGSDSALAEIEKGKVNFDVLVTTPQWMPRFAKLAKILGPKGLMPSPKNGTITDDLKKAVSELQSGKVEYKTEKDNMVIHLGVGKVNQSKEEVTQNIKILFNAIGKTKVKKLTLSPTMGPGIKVELSSI